MLLACTVNFDEELTISRSASKQLGTQLKNKLITAIQNSGPDTAIAVCNIEALPISSKVSKDHNLEVGRTSLKIRNPKNRADNWETKQLQEFAKQKKSGVNIEKLEAHEIINENGEKVFRYMKAILIQEPCLLCHGKQIAPAIEEKIISLYPQDQAIDYEIGDIRGAFTVKKKL